MRVSRVARWMLTLYMSLVFAAGCAPRSSKDTPAGHTIAVRLFRFRAKYEAPPGPYEYVSAAKKELDAITRRAKALEKADGAVLLARASYEALGSGDVLTYADYLIVWRLSGALFSHSPHNRKVVLGMSRKLKARARSRLSAQPREQCSAMFLEVLSPHIPGIKGGIWKSPGRPDWKEWSSFEEAIRRWTP